MVPTNSDVKKDANDPTDTQQGVTKTFTGLARSGTLVSFEVLITSLPIGEYHLKFNIMRDKKNMGLPWRDVGVVPPFVPRFENQSQNSPEFLGRAA